MANVTLSVTETALNVSTTTSNITVTDSDGGQTFNVATTLSNINVTAPVTSVVVSQSAGVSNADVRTAISAYDAGGYGSFSYDSVNGIFTYTGVENTDIWNSLSNTSPITFNKSNGTIGIDSSALFTGKTTDDLAEGATNKYFTAARARGNVSAVDAGGLGSFSYNSTSGEFTYTGPSDSEVRSTISVSDTGGYGSLSYSNTTGVITYVGPSDSDIRSTITAANTVTGHGNISYNSANGQITFSRVTPANILSEVNAGNVLLKQFSETTVNNGNIFGNVTFNLTNGTIHSANVSGNITGISFTGITPGSSATLILKQDVIGSRKLVTTGTQWNNWNFLQDYKTLSTYPGNVDILTVIYDGSTYHASLLNMDEVTAITNSQLANSNVVVNGVTIALGSSGNISSFNSSITVSGNVSGNYFIGNGSLLTGVTSLTNAQVLAYIATQPLTVGGNLDVTGNINATGNINYQNVTDLYVTDQKITLNSNAATNANVEIISNRPTATNTLLKWNEQSTRWEFTNNGTTYYPIPANTGDLAEGSNLWFTTARANSAIDSRLIGGTGISYSSGTIALDFTEFSTSNIAEGSNLWFTTGRANSAIDARVNKAFVEGLGVSYTSLTDKPSIPTHTSNLINDSGYITTANANVISVNSKTGVVSLTTTDIPEGSNLYFTTDRANSAIGAYQGTINTAGNITTTANVQGSYILGNGAFLTGITGGGGSSYGDSNVTSLLANLGSNAISSTANISTTGNLSVGNIVNVTNIEGTGPFATIAMNSINPKEIILGDSFGSKIFFPYNGQSLVGQGQYLRVDSISGAGSTLALKNFGLSFQNIGTFGNVSAGDPANITYSQTTSVVRAGLSGNVADINVSGVAAGDTGWIVIYQPSSTPYQLTLGSSWKMEGCTTGNPVNIAQGYNEESLIFWTYDGTYYRATVTPNIGSNVSVDIRTTGNIVGGNANITNAVNAPTVNGTTVNATTLIATTANATTVNGTTVNATTLVATTANATTVNGTTVNGDTVNANTIATTAASNTVSINANVNANGNIVANASLVTVTNGNNVLLNNERNLGLLIDRNNNSANVTLTVNTGSSSIAYRGTSANPDRLQFPARLEGYVDGLPVTISGFTDPTLAGALNGNVFYLRERPAPTQAGQYDIYSNAGMTTGVNLAVGNLTGTQAGPGAVTFTRRNFVTPKEWSLNVDQVSNDLRIKEDGTTRVTVASGGNLNISGTANANSVVISQPGTAGTYANTLPVDSLAGVSPFTSGFFPGGPSNTYVSVYNSGQPFPTGNIFQLTFSGVTGPGNVNLNGQTFWTNGVALDGYPEFMQLFTDSAATTPANSAVLGVTSQTGSGNVSFNFTPGTAGNNWQLSSVNGNLNIAHNGTVVGNINSAGNLTITGRHTYDRVYGEFYSNVSQSANAANTPTAITLNNTGISSDVSIVNNSNITIAKAGIYNLQFSLQLTNADNSSEHDFDVWLRKNGTDVPNTNTQYTVVRGRSGANGKNVAALNLFLDAAAGDAYQIMFAVTNTQVTVDYIAQQTTPYARPATPSAIVTVAPIGA